MNCDEMQPLLNGYFDGELDLVRTLEFERHVAECSNCAGQLRSLEVLRIAFRSGGLYASTPPRLERRIAALLPDPRVHARFPRLPGMSWLSHLPGAFAAAACLLLVIALSRYRVSVTPIGGGVNNPRHDAKANSNEISNDVIEGEVIDSHIRSLLVNHLNDVASTDRHTVKPWFNGKLDYSPPVFDFKEKGFPLTGGRLDYLNGRSVAALVYHRQKHPINVFVWPSPDADAVDLPTARSKNGYNTVYWRQSGMVFWVVSDLNGAELREFVDDLLSAIRPRARP